MTVGGSTSTSGTLNTKAVQTGTQKFVWNDFSMPVLKANGTIDNTNYTYACAFKGSGGTTAGNVYNAFNNNTANYFGFTATATDTRVLVFYTPYKLKVSHITYSISCNKNTNYNSTWLTYYPQQVTLPSNLDDVNKAYRSNAFYSLSTTTIKTGSMGNSAPLYSNYHCFSTYADDENGNFIQARIHNIVLYGTYQDGYHPTSGTADFTKSAYSVVKDGNIYKAIV